MATFRSSRNRKRARTGNFSQEPRLDKKIMSDGQVSLTRHALRELNRQNKTQPISRATSPAIDATNTSITQFARHGGPDLRHLRGYWESQSAVHAMAPGHLARLSSGQTKPKKSAITTYVSPQTRSSSAYDRDFEDTMYENGVYPDEYERPSARLPPEPENVDQLRLELLVPRDSLSLSQFPDSAFRDFRGKNKACSEATVMQTAFPIITGNSTIQGFREVAFTNINSISQGETVKAVPDFFDGASRRDLSRAIRDELSHLIVPSLRNGVPIAANFFLEAKGPGGDADVALLQAMHDGAIGARAILALQNYTGSMETSADIIQAYHQYDGKAYTMSSTYHSPTSTLQLYAHHVTPPTVPGGRPEYHMTKLRGFCMTDCRETFIQGATAFRNAREIAKRHRDAFIQAANARANELHKT